MKIPKEIRALMLALAFLFLPISVFAQSPPYPPTAPPFSVLGGSVSLSVSGSSSNVALPVSRTPYNAITIYNSGSTDAFFALGASGVTATTSSTRISAGVHMTIWASGLYIAAITSNSTTTLLVYQGTGPIDLGMTGGGAGGGGVTSISNSDGSLTISPTTGAVIAALNTAHANTWSATQTFTSVVVDDLNVSTAPAAITGTSFLASPADAATGRFQANGYGAIGAFTAARYDGTNASPSAVQANDQIGGFNSYAYDGTNLDGPIASVRCYATDTITAAHWGSKCAIATTTTNTTTLADKFTIDQGGNGVLTGALGVASGIAANIQAVTISGGSITGNSTVRPGLAIAGTLNTSGIVDGAAIFANMTNTAVGATSRIIEIQANSASLFSVDFSGNTFNALGIFAAGNISSTSGGVFISNSGAFEWNGRPTFLTSPTAANVQFGAANSGTPVAQTLSFQSGSGTNVAGQPATIVASLGTGNANSGGLNIEVGGAVGASGTTAATPILSLALIPITGAVGVPVGGLYSGAPTGSAEGTGTINAAGAYYANGVKGATCSGALTVIASITITNGIVTAATGTGGTCS